VALDERELLARLCGHTRSVAETNRARKNARILTFTARERVDADDLRSTEKSEPGHRHD
jgi:hypothetical protein